MAFNNKPFRSNGTRTKDAPTPVDLYGTNSTGHLVFGSENSSYFVDVLSVGEITDVKEIRLNGTDSESGEFPNSQFFSHNGGTPETPWDGKYGFAERTTTIGKQADTGEGNVVTTLTRSVTGLGVTGIRVNFTAAAFTQRDQKNRKKDAVVTFKVEILDPITSNPIRTTTQTIRGYMINPTTISVPATAPTGTSLSKWEYRITMTVRGSAYGVEAQGTWNCSTVTELFADTQTYTDIAFVSGDIRAADVGGTIPVRTYLVEGLKVGVPLLEDVMGVPTWLGGFTPETSNSHAWNAMAVLTDEKIFAGLPLDKINTDSFNQFEEYCAETILVDTVPERRFEFSQYIIKSDNYFRLASQIVGAADGKLYEDTTGRIGVLIDKQQNDRRLITSYDVVNQKVNHSDTPSGKKTNFVSLEFDDELNTYEKTIISIFDQPAITKHGILEKKIKLDTCTRESEARRVGRKHLLISQVLDDTYSLTVGHTHEDIQIGEIVELYDRRHSRADFCGKVFVGSTTTVIKVNPNTPIRLTDVTNPQIVIDIEGTIHRVDIASWTSNEITLSTALPTIPADFLSFGVESQDQNGLKPILFRVISIKDNGTAGTLTVEGILYNHSLYPHIDDENQPLIIPVTAIVPSSNTDTIANLQLVKTSTQLLGTWTQDPSQEYVFQWTQDGAFFSSGRTFTSSAALDLPLDLANYVLSVAKIDTDGRSGDFTVVAYSLIAEADGTSSINPPTNVGLDDGLGGSVGTYVGTSFTVVWTPDNTNGAATQYRIRVVQGATNIDVFVPATESSYIVTEKQLIAQFGEDYGRDFTIKLTSLDDEAKSSTSADRLVDNEAIIAPTGSVDILGDVTLTPPAGGMPADAVGTLIYIWQSNDIGSVRPADAGVVETPEFFTIPVDPTLITRDSQNYVYEIAWFDTFGKVELNTVRYLRSFDPLAIIPDPVDLVDVIGITETSAIVRFTHSGVSLVKTRASFRVLGSSTWIVWGTEFDTPSLPADNTSGFDIGTGEGFFLITGLQRNMTYEFRAEVRNTNSLFSDFSNVVTGSPLVDALTADTIGDFIGVDILDDREFIVEEVIDVTKDDDLARGLNKEIVNQDGVLAIIEVLKGQNALISDKIAIVENLEVTKAQRIANIEIAAHGNTAQIETVETAVVTETEARVSAIETLRAEIGEGDIQAQIQTLQIAIATEEEARVAAIESLTVVVDENTASIVTTNTAIVTETTARVEADQLLQVNINEQFATAENNSIVRIGYCTISGNVSAHDTKEACEVATGTWTAAPLAQSVNNVTVVAGGESATVGSMYQTVVDSQGDIASFASFGVTSGGVFTGITSQSSPTVSKLIFQGDTQEFRTASGARSFYYENGKWHFVGDLEGAGGNFTGTLAANTVTSANLQADAVTASKIAADAVTSDAITANVLLEAPHIRSAPSGSRIEIIGDRFEVYEGATLKVRIGRL